MKKSPPSRAARAQPLFEQALALLQQGQAQPALDLARQGLARQPGHHGLASVAGVAAQGLGLLAEAEGYWRAALAARPELAESHFNLANLLRDRGRPQEAEAAYRRALELRPAYPEACNNLGNLHKALGRPQEAEAAYRQALALNPQYPGAWFNLAVLLHEGNRLDEAAAAYRQALHLRPALAEAHNNLGSLLQALGRPQEAAAAYRQALSLRPQYADACHNLGTLLAQEGRPQEAEAAYRRTVELHPQHLAAHLELGNLLRAQGRLEEAEAAYRRVVALRPDHAQAHHDLGSVLVGRARLEEAEAAYRQALALCPDHAEAHYNLGVLMQVRERPQEAEAAYRRALALRPDHAGTHYNLGVLLQACARPQEAEAAYRRALELCPQHADAQHNLGYLLHRTGRLEEAAAAYRQALALRPAYAEAYNNLGNLSQDRGHPAQAEAAYRQALHLRPDYADAHSNLGTLYERGGRLEEAAAAYRQALALQPQFADVYNNLGALLRACGRPDEAEAAFRQALALRPQFAEAHNGLGFLLHERGRLGEALAALRQAVAIRPDYADALGKLLHFSQHACDWRDLASQQARVRALVRGRVAPVSPFTFLALAAPPAEQLACARQWAERMVAVDPGARFAHAPGHHHGRIRLGYLSADFHSHATAYLTAELFERHDREQFEVIGYSYGPDDASPMRARLVRAFDRFVDIRALPHAAAAARIRADAVDILIDLKGYTAHSRSTIPAYRPAPVQVNYLGYPGSMGAPFIDYLIADAFVAPFAHQPFYSEALVHLPDCYQPNDTRRAVAERTPTRAECDLPEQGLVFCCFNNSYKITPEFFAIWMRLLRQTPGSVLWLLESNALVRDNLRREALAHGVEPRRLVFAPRMALADHLARQRLADLFLDTLPVNAHTTASDALWVGLPVLTCVGEAFIGRVGGSLLQAAGLPELITDAPAAYEALALRLAREPGLLADIRGRLAASRSSAPLFDSERYTRHLEAAYRRMWERWCAGQGAAAFAVGRGE